MKISKTSILIKFLKFRFYRKFKSNSISLIKKRKWKKTILSSPYYKNIILKNKEFPVMNKALFMENFNLINTVQIKKSEALKLAFKSEKSRDFTPSINGISIGLSSGTSGSRGIFLTNKKEKEIWVAAILDRVIGFSLKKRKVAFFLRANNNLYEAVKSKLLSFTFFDIKTPVEQHIITLIELNPTILIAQPSMLMKIAQNYIYLKIQPTIQKIISVAEVLEDDQKEYLTSVFNRPIDQVYQCTEGFLAYTCKKGKLHLNEDWLEIEKRYLDEKQDRFHPIITDYLRESQPIVRYELNDILHEGFSCSCGSKSTVISKIEGRSDDVFRFYENETVVDIYPDFIRRVIITASEKVKNYTVVLIEARKINVYLEVADKNKLENIFKTVKKELNTLFLSFGIEDINIVSVDLNHDQINKFRRIKNEYKKSF
tara:strand:- start:1084 stop:2367 length:1284 start_codon:yes stop_codon:yes gene_type:complete